MKALKAAEAVIGVLGAALVLAGVAAFSVPAATILAGIGLLAVPLWPSSRRG